MAITMALPVDAIVNAINQSYGQTKSKFTKFTFS